MCEKAIDLQKDIQIQDGDCVKFKQGEIAFVGKYESCNKKNHVEIVAPDLDMPYDDQDRYAKIQCKLYRLDQLLDIIIKYAETNFQQWKETWYSVIAMYPYSILSKLYEFIRKEDVLSLYFGSHRDAPLEIAALYYLMKYIHNKRWNGEKWV